MDVGRRVCSNEIINGEEYIYMYDARTKMTKWSECVDHDFSRNPRVGASYRLVTTYFNLTHDLWRKS